MPPARPAPPLVDAVALADAAGALAAEDRELVDDERRRLARRLAKRLRRYGLDPADPGGGQGNVARWSTDDVLPLRIAVGLDELGAPDQVLEAAAAWARSIDLDAVDNLDGLFAVIPADVATFEPYTPRDRLPYLSRASGVGLRLTGRNGWVVGLGRRLDPSAVR